MSRRRLVTTLAIALPVLSMRPSTASTAEGCALMQPGTGATQVFPSPLPRYYSVGWDDGDVQSCSYTATRRAGYRGSGTWSISVESRGTTIVRNHLTSGPCANAGFIQPGDVVTVSTRTAAGASIAGTAIAAGPDIGC